MKRAWPLLVILAGLASSQDPIIGPQMRTSLDNLCKSASETTGAASANGREVLAGFVDFRVDGTIKNAFAVTSDGGATWSHLVVRPPAQYQDSLEADPMTAYDARTNTLFAGGISRAKCIYVARKLSGQNAFTPSNVAVLSTWPDKGWMAAGPRYGLPNTTRLYVTYNEGIIWSDDLGITWTPPLGLGTGFGFLPRVGPEGQLYLTYWDGYWGIKFTKSLDGGQTWSPVLQPATRMQSWGVENYGIPGTFRNFTNNTIAVNPANGHIVIMYVDQTNIVNGQKNLDLYMVRSTDQGTSWSAAERLPFRPLNQVSDMIFPWIEFTKDGRLHLFAMDTALDPGQTDGVAHGLWNQTYYCSDDSGASWSARFRLTPNSWDSYNEGSGANFLGDYQGMAISDHSLWPVYSDTSDGQAEAIVNRISIPDNFVLTLNKSSVAGQNSVLGTIAIEEARVSNTVFTTYDNSSLVTTPPSVTILAGQVSRNFQILVTAITSNVLTTIYAKRGVLTRSRTLRLTPLIPTALAFSPNTITGGNTTSCRVVVNGVAGPGGRVIAIFDNSIYATAPGTVTVPPGASDVTFPITTITVTAFKTVTVTARVSAGEKSGTFRIQP